MNRIFYDVQVTQRAGGNGENWKPICSKTHQACPQLCGATGFCQNKQEEKSTKTQTHSGWDWFCPPHFPEEPGAYICVVAKSGEYPILALNLKLKYLEYAQGEDNFRGLEEGEYVPRWLGKIYAPSSGRHLSPSPGLRWVRASERLPEKCNDVIIRVIGKPVEVAVGCVADSEEEWAVDGCSWFYYDTEWLDESPSLPGEQDPAPKLADTIKWMSEGARRNLKSCETNLLEAHYEGYLEALEELSKEMELTPSAEKGEQVEGKAFENISRIIHPATESTDRTLPFAPPSAEADQKPLIGDSLVKWLNAQGPQTDQQGEIPKMSDQLAAESDMAAIDYGQVCEKFIGSSPYDNTHITEAFERGQSWMYRKLQPEIATLRSSAKSSIYQHDQDMEIVKEENQKLRAHITDLIAEVVKNSEEAAEYKTALMDLNKEIDEIWNTHGISKRVPDWIIKSISNAQQKTLATLNKFTNNTKDK